VTLLVLAIQYEIVNFSLRSTLIWWRVFSGLYGLAILVLGCIELGLEISGMQSTCQAAWDRMTSNQKLYFQYNVDNLVSERTKNASMIGAFAIVIGFLIIVQVLSLHYLAMASALSQGSKRKNLTSRMPVVEHHEQMNFVYLTQREEEDGDHDEAGSKLALNTVERRDDVAEEQEVLI
jgi:hypothetical protein